MKTEKIICRFRLQFVTLLLMVSMVLPTVMWAAITPTKPSSGDGSSSNPYQIGTATELYWFAALVNGKLTDGTAKNTAACAKLMNNITVNSGVLKSDGNINSDNVSGFTAWTPIGYFNSSSDYACYNGTFDGNGKTISGLYLDNKDMSYIGLFGYSSGTIKNVGVVDSYFKGYVYIGGVCGYNAGTVKLCYSNSYLYGSNIGGVCGLNFLGAVITNCYSTGIIKGGENVGGVCGANTNASITNCHNVGSLSGSTSVGSVCGNNTGTITKCYYDNVKCKIKGINGSDVSGQAEGKSTTQFQSGEVAYLLQGNQSEIVWGQTIGSDSYPVIGGKEVYYGYVDCQNGMTYSNNTETSDTPLHSYNNGFCTVCDAYQPAEYVSESHHAELLPQYYGYYAIENAGQLYWFANRVNNDGYNGIDAVLTDYITVNSGVIDSNGELASNTSEFRKWTPIGWWTETGSVKYNGIIDGNNHYISGLYFNDENANSVGLLG
ncbi:MAG: GLUG motif-containing protein, partial [Prevotella sp.]|nr:GLUG motif-containing protein [Prevotella sp.]